MNNENQLVRIEERGTTKGRESSFVVALRSSFFVLRSFLVLSSSFFVLSAAPFPLTAQQVTPGSYTEAQAVAGRAVYQSTCASCHLPDLAGSNEAPPLAGVNFQNQWGDRTAAALQDFIQKTMPPGGLR